MESIDTLFFPRSIPLGAARVTRYWRRLARCLCAGLVLLGAPALSRAQGLPNAPVTLADGQIILGGQVSAAGSSDDPGYYDYSSYDANLMRLARFDATGFWRLSDHVSFTGDLRVEGSTGGGGGWRIRPYAAFVRLRPWTARAFDIQAGLVPPVFGAFGRRAYAVDNPLIGFPLAYQYLTSLRADAAPASADDLLGMRGRGWLTHYSVGSAERAAGLPIVDGLHYQTGVEAHVGNGRPIEVAGSVTAGSLAVPSGEYAPAGRQFSGRVAVRPRPELVLGFSASRGEYIADYSVGTYSVSLSGTQTAFGFDIEASHGHWLLRSEGVFSRWRLPRVAAPAIDGPLDAFTVDLEARYRILPGLYVATRLDRLDFSSVTGSAGTMSWEYPVRRVEVATGYSLFRRMLLKAAWQRNWRVDSATPARNLVAAQVVAWF